MLVDAANNIPRDAKVKRAMLAACQQVNVKRQQLGSVFVPTPTPDSAFVLVIPGRERSSRTRNPRPRPEGHGEHRGYGFRARGQEPAPRNDAETIRGTGTEHK